MSLGDQLPTEIHAQAGFDLGEFRTLKGTDGGTVARRREEIIKVQAPPGVAGSKRRFTSCRSTVPGARDLSRAWRHVEEVGKIQVVAGVCSPNP